GIPVQLVGQRAGEGVLGLGGGGGIGGRYDGPGNRLGIGRGQGGGAEAGGGWLQAEAVQSRAVGGVAQIERHEEIGERRTGIVVEFQRSRERIAAGCQVLAEVDLGVDLAAVGDDLDHLRESDGVVGRGTDTATAQAIGSASAAPASAAAATADGAAVDTAAVADLGQQWPIHAAAGCALGGIGID